MANQLPTVVLDGVTYYIDHRLGQLREVNNPHNTRPIEDMELPPRGLAPENDWDYSMEG